METFIVRIYRRDGKDLGKVAGVVERVGEGGRKSFSGPDALWRILSSRRRESRRAAETPRGARRGRGAMTLSEIMKKVATEKG